MAHILQNNSIDEILKEIENRFGCFYSYTTQYKTDDPENKLAEVINKHKNYNKMSNWTKVYDSMCIKENNYKLKLRLSGTEPIIKIYTFSEVFNDENLKELTIQWIKMYFN